MQMQTKKNKSILSLKAISLICTFLLERTSKQIAEIKKKIKREKTKFKRFINASTTLVQASPGVIN